MIFFITKGAEVSPLLNQSMEKSETEQELLPNGLFFGAVKEIWVRDGVTKVGAQQVGSNSFRRLISHLQSILQDTNWELV